MIIKSVNGYDILVDEQDYDILSRHRWNVDKHGYAVTSMSSKNMYMHRMVFGTVPQKHVVDHVNRNKLDNRRENLRMATRADNLLNSRNGVANVDYVGVRANGRKYAAYTGIKGKNVYIGTADTAEDAAKLRDAFAYTLHGEFIYLNFPGNVEEYKTAEFPDRLKKYL